MWKKAGKNFAILLTAVVFSLISCTENESDVPLDDDKPNENIVVVESSQSIRLLTSIEEAAAKTAEENLNS